MGQPHRREAARAEQETERTAALGPPGWDEFAAARERFMRTIAVAGLETAWAAPPREPRPERRGVS